MTKQDNQNILQRIASIRKTISQKNLIQNTLSQCSNDETFDSCIRYKFLYLQTGSSFFGKLWLRVAYTTKRIKPINDTTLQDFDLSSMLSVEHAVNTLSAAYLLGTICYVSNRSNVSGIAWVAHIRTYGAEKQQAVPYISYITKQCTRSDRLMKMKSLVQTDSNVLVSISGGQDSTFLFLTLYVLATQMMFRCHLLCCNHFWQITSFYTTLHVTRLALCLSSPIISFVPLTSVLSEKKARDWRHTVTDRACAFYGYGGCMYGHSKTDRVETVLFNLIRGAGTRGVASLQWGRQHSSFSYNKLYPTLKQMLIETHIT